MKSRETSAMLSQALLAMQPLLTPSCLFFLGMVNKELQAMIANTPASFWRSMVMLHLNDTREDTEHANKLHTQTKTWKQKYSQIASTSRTMYHPKKTHDKNSLWFLLKEADIQSLNKHIDSLCMLITNESAKEIIFIALLSPEKTLADFSFKLLSELHDKGKINLDDPEHSDDPITTKCIIDVMMHIEIIRKNNYVGAIPHYHSQYIRLFVKAGLERILQFALDKYEHTAEDLKNALEDAIHGGNLCAFQSIYSACQTKNFIVPLDELLLEAAKLAQLDILNAILDLNADPNPIAEKMPALNAAIGNEDKHSALALLNKGASIKKISSFHPSPLYVALSMKNKEMIDLLLSSNPTPDLSTTEENLVECARKNDHLTAIPRLLEYKANDPRLFKSIEQPPAQPISAQAQNRPA
ncbi:MAG TPA: hypothetical protein VFU82_07195 [Gammaproteobacteria bacterium]|nr:hypothetical protein [Gammaproteobacteria bacterium]